MLRKIPYLVIILWYLLPANTTFAYTHADTLRGSNGSGRSWWDVQQYNLYVRFDTLNRSISGHTEIVFKVIHKPIDSMQIDLQTPLEMDSVILLVQGGQERLKYVKEGNVWWVTYPFHTLKENSEYTVRAYYHGAPRVAVHPPWDGGFSWARDQFGKQWIAVSCQGLGASVWWPCKDAQWDEPDKGVHVTLDAPGNLKAISNGMLVSERTDDRYTATTWEVKNPINNYDVTFYLGNYVHRHDTMMCERGKKLDLDYWVLRENEEKSKSQFEVVKPMLRCFEHWMGPYPFYDDGYKLVDAPYLGMEHQGAIAYGNKYMKGYLGYDRSLTGYGSEWDYIIVHESGHEWFGNNVTARDMADNWIHEGITSYSEALFTECLLGKDKGMKYSRGLWHNIKNEKPVIGHYGVNEEGPGDIYEKGAAIMHMIRVMTNDDEKFRGMLRGLSKEFYHQVVTTKQVEDYIMKETGLELTAFFNQYLRTANIPEIEYYIKKDMLYYKFNKVVDGFSLPITVTAGGEPTAITPTAEWQQISWKDGYNVKFSDDFLIKVKK